MKKSLLLIVAACVAACQSSAAPSVDYAADPALAPPPVNTSPGEEYGDNRRIFQGIPGIERAGNGRLWALWYSGGPGEGPLNYVVLVNSGDDGRTWSKPGVVIDPPGDVRAYDPTLWVDPTGKMWLFWAQSYNWWDGRSGVWAITTENPGDERPKWSEPRRLCDGIMMNKPVVLRSGEWLLPAAIWSRPADKRTDAAHAHDLTARRGSHVVVSTDQGRTWRDRGHAVVPDVAFDEHMVVERRDGSLWMLVRTSYGIGESVSTDGGRTWSPGGPSHIPNVNSRFHIRRLASGNLLLVAHNPPDGKTRSHLTAHISDDDGKTWRGSLMIDERPNVSYPDATQAPGGTIYLIYDFERTKAKQVLMAVFRESDVTSGGFDSPGSRQRVLVNQATGERPTKPVKKKPAVAALVP